MSTTPLQDIPPFAGYDDDEHHPLGGYGALMAVWGAAMAGFLAWKGDELGFLAGVLAAHAGADALQVGYSAAENASGSLRPG